jgi:RNA polymerase sigma-70 factor (ECF subfamily)
MTQTDPAQDLPQPGPRGFVATPWTDVLLAADADAPAARDALERLCHQYWYPLYAHVRHQSASPQDAEDFTQEFFRLLIEKNYLGAVDRRRGKFRSFLLVALNRFLINARKHNTRLKRGGGQTLVSLDAVAAEDRYRTEPATHLAPDRLFDRRWAETVLAQATAQLRAEYAAAGKAALFEILSPLLTAESRFGDYTDLAHTLGLTPGAVAVAVHRLRQRHRDCVRAVVRPTVAAPADVDSEMQYLASLLGP